MTDSDEELIIDEDTQSYQSQSSQLIHDTNQDTINMLLHNTVDDFKEILPDIKIELDQQNLINIKIPTSILPLAMNVVYGFTDCIYLLEINLQLKDMDWTEKPVILNYSNPTYKTNFIGKSLIQDVFTNFFSQNYIPRNKYKCSSFLLTQNGVPNQNALLQLLSEGFDNKAAESALLLCGNNIELARDFLITGDFPVSVSLPIQYVECPLVYLIFEIGEAFFDISDHCCMCRKLLPTPGLKPSVCDSEMCHFQFECLGVGTSVLQEIKRDPIVADLLVCIFSAAQSSNFLNPAPPKELLSKSSQIIANLPPMRTIAESNKNDTDMIKKYGNDTVDLLRWVLLSNRSHLITLPDALRLPEFPDTVQFMTLLSTPQAELSFKRLLGGERSIFLWHGSGGDRWHAILRNGLKNATGTAMQANGAAMGAGIYLAANSGTSWGYTRETAHAYRGSVLGPAVSAVALCEVANTPKLKDNGWAHVLKDEAAVVVRFLMMGTPFAADVLANPPTSIPTLDAVLRHKARAALEGVESDVTIPAFKRFGQAQITRLVNEGIRRRPGAGMPGWSGARGRAAVRQMAAMPPGPGPALFHAAPAVASSVTSGIRSRRAAVAAHNPPPPTAARRTRVKKRRAPVSVPAPVSTPVSTPVPVSAPVPSAPSAPALHRGGVTLTEFQDDPYSGSSASSRRNTPSVSPVRPPVAASPRRRGAPQPPPAAAANKHSPAVAPPPPAPPRDNDDEVVEIGGPKKLLRRELPRAPVSRLSQSEVGGMNLLSPQGQGVVVVKQEPGVFSLFPSQHSTSYNDSDSDSSSSTDLFK